MTLHLPVSEAGRRLDLVLAGLLPEYSRSQIQDWLRAGFVRLDGAQAEPSLRVRGGEEISVALPEPEPQGWVAQPLPLDMVFEDGDILVLNKPAGLVTHPGAGNARETLANAVLHRCPANAALPRAGIVHRLDKDTSGLLVVAKTELARQSLVAQLGSRTMHREYLALVNGAMTGGGKVEAAIGRHPRDRLRMAVLASGKPAVTQYRLAERFPRHSLLRLKLGTGRTHQIRVHMASIGHPLVGDLLYGGRQILPPGLPAEGLARWAAFRRQALHATRLRLVHPRSGEALGWEVPLPEDLEGLLALLRGVDGR